MYYLLKAQTPFNPETPIDQQLEPTMLVDLYTGIPLVKVDDQNPCSIWLTTDGLVKVETIRDVNFIVGTYTDDALTETYKHLHELTAVIAKGYRLLETPSTQEILAPSYSLIRYAEVNSQSTTCRGGMRTSSDSLEGADLINLTEVGYQLIEVIGEGTNVHAGVLGERIVSIMFNDITLLAKGFCQKTVSRHNRQDLIFQTGREFTFKDLFNLELLYCETVLLFANKIEPIYRQEKELLVELNNNEYHSRRRNLLSSCRSFSPKVSRSFNR